MPPYVAPPRAGYTEGMIAIRAVPSTVQQTIPNVPLGTSTSGTWPVIRPLTAREFMEQQYLEGELLNLPTRQPWSQEERAERERLAQAFAGGKSASEMVIEDRGPR
jgi:hypothetical protein